MEAPLELLIRGGRVLDPASGFDRVADIGIRGGVIARIGECGHTAPVVIEAAGLTVVPGFIDLHSHAQTPLGLELQALDGVTTALDLESGALPAADHLAAAAARGRAINFGYSASWALARMHVMDGLDLPRADGSGIIRSSLEVVQRNQHRPRWRERASPHELDRILAILAGELESGAVGIGVLLGYSPQTGREEFYRLAQLAEAAGVALFVHARNKSNLEPDSSLDGVLEIIGAAAGTGAHIHVCHINSTAMRRIDEIAEVIARAQSLGVRISTEAYPYMTGSTGIGASFLDPSGLARLGIGPSSITYLATGERVADTARLTQLRSVDPGGLCLIDFLDADDPRDTTLLERSFELADTVVGSDAMPIVDAAGTYLDSATRVVPGMRTHPRSAGTFARTFGVLVRDSATLSIGEAVMRTSTIPARLLSPFVARMRRKGRVVEGFDADLTVLDESTVSDRATFSEIVPSRGIKHVIVGGARVVSDGVLVSSDRGRAIRTDRRRLP